MSDERVLGPNMQRLLAFATEGDVTLLTSADSLRFVDALIGTVRKATGGVHGDEESYAAALLSSLDDCQNLTVTDNRYQSGRLRIMRCYRTRGNCEPISYAVCATIR